VRARAIGEDHADAAAYRETPARLREWVEKKTREGVDSTAVMIHRSTSREAAGAVDLQSHVAAEWQIRADASVQRPGLRRAHVDRVDTQFERWKRRTRRLLRARRGREREERQHRPENYSGQRSKSERNARARSVHGARKLDVAAGAFQRAACLHFTRGLSLASVDGSSNRFAAGVSPPAPTRLSRDYQHIVADFLGVPANQLGDRALISGLIVAAASAAGMNASGVPTMRERKAGGLTAALLHDDCHITVHAVPERELLLVDVLTPRALNASRAVDVFARRLTARQVHRDARDRA